MNQSRPQIAATLPQPIMYPGGQSQARIVQQGGQQFLMHGGAATNLTTGSNVMVLNAAPHIPAAPNNNSMYQQQRNMQSGMSNAKPETTLPMLDGTSSLAKFTSPIRSSFCVNKKIANGKTDQKSKVDMKKVIQLDGADRISESSTEEEDLDEEEEYDPLRRIANRIDEEQANAPEDEEQVANEEDPLNSGDDQSDDEDIDELFEAENLVMCQFEKIHRARSKWKFTLKDGIMHISGKDHCFQRCSGEAEW
ncbi:unnamed protein product [Gongylonema pulchrum]|uniref:Uncharacterized protein n=1 Tax=Gongylonema pulchrum TaxID=637853 RepID=A0A183E089_9BILA|nr:unnamed protein product [Gongylonema pulchrum]